MADAAIFLGWAAVWVAGIGWAEWAARRSVRKNELTESADGNTRRNRESTKYER